jgi:hypothetical protein
MADILGVYLQNYRENITPAEFFRLLSVTVPQQYRSIYDVFALPNVYNTSLIVDAHSSRMDDNYYRQVFQREPYVLEQLDNIIALRSRLPDNIREDLYNIVTSIYNNTNILTYVSPVIRQQRL